MKEASKKNTIEKKRKRKHSSWDFSRAQVRPRNVIGLKKKNRWSTGHISGETADSWKGEVDDEDVVGSRVRWVGGMLNAPEN